MNASSPVLLISPLTVILTSHCTLNDLCGRYSFFFFFSTAHLPVDQNLHIIEASRSHSDTPHSARLLWTSVQPNAQTSTWQHTTLAAHKTDIHAFGGIRTCNPSQRAAAGPGLKPRGHWDRPTVVMATSNN